MVISAVGLIAEADDLTTLNELAAAVSPSCDEFSPPLPSFKKIAHAQQECFSIP
jgi:hypothetical protein